MGSRFSQVATAAPHAVPMLSDLEKLVGIVAAMFGAWRWWARRQERKERAKVEVFEAERKRVEREELLARTMLLLLRSSRQHLELTSERPCMIGQPCESTSDGAARAASKLAILMHDLEGSIGHWQLVLNHRRVGDADVEHEGESGTDRSVVGG